MPSPTPRPCLAAAMIAALAACSAAEDPAPTDALAPAPAAPTAAASDARTAPAPKGDCDLITHDEVSQAFAGKLTVRRSGGHGGRGGGCTYDIAEVSESQLILQAGNAASYEMRKESYSSQSGITMEPIALGQEGFLANRAQVIVLTEDGQSLSLGLQMFTIGKEPPVSHTEVSIALQALTLKAMDRM